MSTKPHRTNDEADGEPTAQTPLMLSRAVGDRVLLSVLALPLFLIGAYALFRHITEAERPDGGTALLWFLVVREALVAFTGVTLLSLVWAVAAPRWLAKVIEKWAASAFFWVLVFVLVAMAFV